MRGSVALMAFSAESLKGILDRIPHLFCVFTLDFHLIFVNSAYCKYWGKTEEELVGKSWLELIPPESHEAMEKVKNKLLRTDGILTFVCETEEHGKTKHSHRWTQNLIRNLEGEAIAIQAVGHDVTEERKALLKLTESRRLFHTILEDMGEGIVVMDANRNITFCNRKMTQMLKLPEDQIIGHSVLEFTSVPPESITSSFFLDHLDGSLKYQTELFLSDGSSLPVYISGTALRDKDGEFIGIAAIVEDLSDRQKARATVSRRVRLEQLASRISFSLKNSEDDLDSAVDAALGRIGAFTGSDRAYVFSFNKDYTIMTNIHEWCSEGITPQKDNLQDLSTCQFPWWMENLKNRNRIIINDVKNMPKEAYLEKEIIQSQGIKSLLVLPYYLGEELGGFVGLDNCHGSFSWQKGDIALLQLVSQMIGDSFRTRIYRKALEFSEKRYRSIVENQQDFVLRFDPDLKVTFANQAFSRFIHIDTRKLKGMDVTHFCDTCTLLFLREVIPFLKPGEEPAVYEEGFRSSGSVDRKDLEWMVNGIFDDQGDLREIQAVVRDITSRRKAEREREEFLSKLKNSLEKTIGIISHMVEVRDPYTGGHHERVALLARSLAEKLVLPEEEKEYVYYAALIHDMGKINVPSEILSKPGKLEPFEFELVKSHSALAYQVLHKGDLPVPIDEIVLQHHERMDGSGYPDGLKGEEILIGARIIAVADVVEAMCSHRPYRPARGIDLALEEIEQNSGKLYDKKVVDACLCLFREEGFTFQDL